MKYKNSFFLTVLEAGKHKIKTLALGVIRTFLLLLHIAEGGRSRGKQAKCCKKTFYKDLIPTNEEGALLA